MGKNKFYELMQKCEALNAFVTAARWTIERDDNIDRGMHDGDKWTKVMADGAFEEVQEAFVGLAEYLKLPAVGELLRTIAEEHFPNVDKDRIAALDQRLAVALTANNDYIEQIARIRARVIGETKKVFEVLARGSSPFISKCAFDHIPSDALKVLDGIIDRIMSDANDIPF